MILLNQQNKLAYWRRDIHAMLSVSNKVERPL